MQARLFAKGQKIANPDPRLAIYVDCHTWNCLPQGGGWYDQDPEICEAFTVIENEVNKVKNEKARQEELKMKK